MGFALYCLVVVLVCGIVCGFCLLKLFGWFIGFVLVLICCDLLGCYNCVGGFVCWNGFACCIC